MYIDLFFSKNNKQSIGLNANIAFVRVEHTNTYKYK